MNQTNFDTLLSLVRGHARLAVLEARQEQQGHDDNLVELMEQAQENDRLERLIRSGLEG